MRPGQYLTGKQTFPWRWPSPMEGLPILAMR